MRKSGQLSEAIALVNILLAQAPDNLYNRRAAGWVYLELIKTQCNTVSELNTILAMITNLTLAQQEEIFWEQLCWQVAKLFFRLDSSTNAECWTVFYDLWAGIPHNASLGNSTLLKAILKHQTEIPYQLFCRDVKVYNLFQTQDYLPEAMANGKAMPALVERYFIVVAKNWSTLIEKDNSVNLVDELTLFLEKLDRVSEDYPKMVYLIYYRAVLRMNLGKFAEAKEMMIPFAQKKQTEFWVWDLLAQLHPTDIDMQFACLAKALLCKASPDFLVKVRQKMVGLLILRQEWSAARAEIDNIVATRTSNKWQIPGQLKEWLLLPEISNDSRYTSVSDLYTTHSIKAESILQSNNLVKGIIWKINLEKKTAQFFVDEKIFGGFNYERFKVDTAVGACMLLSLREIKNVDGSFWQVITAQKSDNEVPVHLEKHFNGTLKKVGSLGFVENVLIEPSLMTSKKGLVAGKAIRAYDANKKVWGWKAISMEESLESIS